MKLFSSKWENTEPYERSNEVMCKTITAHKFAIDIYEVFGYNFSTKGISEWLIDKPDEVFVWLNMPHNPIYIEYNNMFDMSKYGNKSRYSLLVEEEDGVLTIYPISIINGISMLEPLSMKLGIGRVLNRADFSKGPFKQPEMYDRWLSDDSNTTKRVAAISHTNVSTTFQELIMSTIPALLETILYINSKGIGTTINTAKVKKNKKRKSPYTHWDYYTLRIVKKGEKQEIVNKTKYKIPFIYREHREHTVRGHVAIYTKEKPLFGNPKNVGPIWISPHIRNEGTEGKIIKDYEVK